MDAVSTGVGIVVASKELMAGVREFTLKILGPGAEQAGLIIDDWARLFRVKNLISIKDKFERICMDNGIKPTDRRYLAMSVGLPLLEKASYQDNDFLQERWAHLIANSLRSDEQSEDSFSLDITYVEILNQLSQLDCEILEYIVEHGVESRDEKTGVMKGVGLDPDDIRKRHPNRLAHLSLEKLISLGCAASVMKAQMDGSGGNGYGAWAHEIVITLIGVNLYISASGKTPKWLGEENG